MGGDKVVTSSQDWRGQLCLFLGNTQASAPAFRSPWQDWLEQVEIVYLTDLNSWRMAVEEACKVEVCGWDTETTGIDPVCSQLRLIQIAVPIYPEGKKRVAADDGRTPEPGSSAKAYVLDLYALSEEARKEALELLADLVADPAVIKVGHNLAFDLAFLRAALGRRIACERIFDTMLASQLCTAGDFVPGGRWEKWVRENGYRFAINDHGQELKTKLLDSHNHFIEFDCDHGKEIKPYYPTHSLQQVAHRHMEVWLDKQFQVSDWSGELSGEQLRYAGWDAAVVLPLYEILAKLLGLNQLVSVAKIEFGCLPAAVEVKLAGMPFDAARAKELLTVARAEQARCHGELKVLADKAGFVPRPKKGKKVSVFFNPDSGVDCLDLLKLLVQREGLLTERGNMGGDVKEEFIVGGEVFEADTRDETLTRLIARLPEENPLRQFAESLRAYRAAKKKADFLEKWLQLLHPKTERLHPDLRQINPQGVGRFSARNPNLQQAPKGSEIRELFKAPDGCRLVVADYSAIEMRIMAQLSRDVNLRRAFLEGVDVHTYTAAKMAGKPLEEVTKEERQAAKAFNFGLIYGMQGETLRQYAETSYGVKMTLSYAPACGLWAED